MQHKLAISNIAWSKREETEVAVLLMKLGVAGVEIAPTAVWQDINAITEADLLSYRRFWQDHGIEIIAMQSLLFGRPELQLFGEPSIRIETTKYLRMMVEIGAAVGAKALVFGSPKNRIVPAGMTTQEAWSIAKEFFAELGTYAAQHKTAICIEANPQEYGGNFILTTEEAAELVATVNTPGFGLHLDIGGMVLAKSDPHEVITKFSLQAKHLHLSSPYIEPIYTADINYGELARSALTAGYKNWFSIEMKAFSNTGSIQEHVQRAIECTNK